MTILDKNYQLNELIYERSGTLVYRGKSTLDQGDVIVELTKPSQASNTEILLLKNQYTVLKNLNLQGVVKVIDFRFYGDIYFLILEDFGSTSLQNYFQQIRLQAITIETIDGFLNSFLPIAIQLAKILGELYHHSIIHKDINPTNIYIDLPTQLVKLTNFSYAIRAEKNPTSIPNQIQSFEGTLAYASPEQTGRINRGVDYRSDFYSLGITFYELLTGFLPFDAEDPIELTHAHLTKLPISVHNINSLIPLALSEIVAKLMAKNVEDRYQSAFGLQRDLEYCLSQWQAQGQIENFELEKRVAIGRFVIPNKIYGRTAEIQILLNAFEQIISPPAKHGGRVGAELILVSGFFGVGKTTIINEAIRLICRHKYYIIQGEFVDREPGNTSFSPIIQAFRSLIQQLSIEDDQRVAKYRDAILSGLGDEGQVIIDIIPELTQIIGSQPAVRLLTQSATKNRFKLLFHKFVKILAIIDRPLLLFLDNIQWADYDALELIELLILESSQLSIVCAYRDNELSGIHPLLITVNRLKRRGIAVKDVILSPLSVVHINELVADCLNSETCQVQKLSELVHRKTNGNPFFVIKFLQSLIENKLITFNHHLESWDYDLSQIKIQSLTNDEIDLMANQLQSLPQLTQELLQLAACLGNQFELQTLAIICQRSAEEVEQILLPALQAGSILLLQETAKFLGSKIDDTSIDRAVVISYQFTHDRVQQAAYSLIPLADRADIHDQISRLLWATIAPAEAINSVEINLPVGSEQRLLIVANQLNYRVNLTNNVPAEIGEDCARKHFLIALNLAAIRQARSKKADQIALQYAQVGLKLLDGKYWQDEYTFALAISQLAIELASICGEFALMNQWIEQTIVHVTTPLDLVGIYTVKIQSLVSQNFPVIAIEVGRSILAQLGIEFPLSPTFEDVETAIQEIDELLRDRSIETLVDLPAMTNPHQLGIMQVAASILGACYAIDPVLCALVTTLQVKFSIQNGNSPSSAYSYAAYGIVINNLRQDVALADRFSGVAYNLATRTTGTQIRSATLAAIGLFLYHRNGHLRSTIPIFQAGYQAGLAAGQLEHVGYHIQGLFSMAYWCGENLSELKPRFSTYRQQLIDSHQLTILNYCDIYYETVLYLIGDLDRINLAVDQVEPQELIIANQNLERVFLFYFHRLMLQFTIGDLDQANIAAHRARTYLCRVQGLICEVIFYFYDALIALTVVPASPDQLVVNLERVRSNQQQLAYWAKYAPMNHLHKWQLVEAETHRVLGNKAAAIEFYDLAISGAEANKYLSEAALANELAGKFYLDWGKDKLAADYLQAARSYYTQWGAVAKVQALTDRYPFLVPDRSIPESLSTIAVSKIPTQTDSFDFVTTQAEG